MTNSGKMCHLFRLTTQLIADEIAAKTRVRVAYTEIRNRIGHYKADLLLTTVKENITVRVFDPLTAHAVMPRTMIELKIWRNRVT